MAAHESNDEGAYPLDLIPDGSGWQIGTRSLFDWLIRDIQHGSSASDMGRRFHSGLVGTLVDLCRKLRARSRLNRVCLSSG